MAQLIQMRQRIKAIETIKKITHAMRLISMSMHSRLRNKTPLLKKYNNEIENLFKKLRSISPKWQNAITNPQMPKEFNPLFIIVGSQKGLCGTFNTNLIKEFEKAIPLQEIENTNFILVGKKAVDYFADKNAKSIVKQFSEINMRNFTKISSEIVDIIINATTPYSCVKILSNELKTFFHQKPRLIQLIPIEQNFSGTSTGGTNTAQTGSTEKTSSTGKPEETNLQNKTNLSPQENAENTEFSAQDFVWFQKSEDILDQLAPQYIASNVNAFLIESLLAEQAARFLSMDTATRNAKNLLEETTLQYNKLRQAKITKELTELATNFE